MKGLTTPLLARACRIFLTLSYPDGPGTIPPPRQSYFNMDPGLSLESFLAPPVCQALVVPETGNPKLAFRLGSAVFPHLKLQILDCDNQGTLVFAVETHDAFRPDSGHPDAAAWAQLQLANRLLKEQIEHAWEKEGFLTFNALLKRKLGQP